MAKVKLPKSEIIIASYPKCGATWLARLLGKLLDCEVTGKESNIALAQEGAGRPGKYIVRQLHCAVSYDDADELLPEGDKIYPLKWSGEKIILMMRDPRDIAVSVMYYWNMKKLGAAIKTLAHPSHILDVSLSDYLSAWWSAPFSYSEILYERLLLMPEETLMDLLVKLKLPVPDVDKLESIIKEESFTQRRKRIEKKSDFVSYNKAIQLRHMRKGAIGDWKIHFNRSDGKAFHRYFWDLLFRLGYEYDKNWWKWLPEG